MTRRHRGPERQPDVVVEERTPEEAVAFYRLDGDRNALHIDPEFSKVGGFNIPIAYRLRSFGFRTMHCQRCYGVARRKTKTIRRKAVLVPGSID